MSLMFACPQFSEPIVLRENTVHTLVLEKPAACRKFLSEFMLQKSGGEGGIVLSENFEPIALSAYAELIIDPLTVQPNTRPVLTKLYSALANTANDETHFAEFSELQAHIEAFLYSVCEAQETELVFNGGLEAAQLFKAADVRFDFASERPLTERLLDYMRVNSQYLKTKVFLLYNIKDVLEKEELETLCQALFYNKILFLLVQSEAKYRVANETQWILDNDLCEIY